MPSKPQDRSKDTFQPIDLVAAEKIISITLHKARRELHRPSPEALIEAVCRLLDEYQVRRVVDGMPDLEVYGKVYRDLGNELEKLNISLDRINCNYELLHFFLVALPYSETLTPEMVEDSLLTFRQTANEIATFAKLACNEVQSSASNGSETRWYKFIEGRATNWLYGDALPKLFECLFKAPYAIAHEQESTSPGLRFAQALLAAAKLPSTSRSNLRKRLELGGHHHLAEGGDGSH